MPSPSGVSRALCAPPRCGVRAWRTEVFAIVGKNRDRWRRRSLRRRDGCHEVTDEGSSRATVPLPSPSSPPSAAPKGKPSSSLASPVQGEVACRRQDGRVVVHARHQPLQPSRLASLGTLPCTGRARVRYYNALPIQFCSSAKPLLNPATIAGFSFIQSRRRTAFCCPAAFNLFPF